MKIYELKKADAGKVFFKQPFVKRLILMILGVIFMGICVAILRLCKLGTDPFSAVSYGIAYFLGVDFGTVQMLFNGTLLILVLFSDISKLGFGTLGNMIFVGYSADLTTYVLEHLLGITELHSLAARIIVMIVTLFVFIIAVSVYINAGLGSSAYDALPYVIHDGVTKLIKKEIPFKITRILFDGFFTFIAFLIHGEAGVITVLMVFTLGPMIDYVAKLLSVFFKNDKA